MNTTLKLFLNCWLIGLLSGGSFSFAQEKPYFSKPVGSTRYKLMYNEPSANWNEALPIGNGFLGAMVFGGIQQERLQLNETTIWGGGPNNNVDTAAKTAINEVRSLLNQKKYVEAQTLANQKLGPKGNSGMPYQLAGNLYIDFPGHERAEKYHRDLDIENAIATVSYTVNGIRFKREYFTSFTKNVLVARLTADHRNSINFKAKLQSPLAQKMYAKDKDLILYGKGSDHENQKGKVQFNVVARAKTIGGLSRVDSSGIVIENADTAIIFLAIATNFVNYKDLSADPLARALNTLNNGHLENVEELLATHRTFYKNYFNRVKLDLGTSKAMAKPTNIRIQEFANGNDPQLAELYFQFGRYLLISSSQPGSQPANLQGIWNGELKGPWDSKYTVNINTEMNYWPSEVTQLSELNAPLFNMIKDLSVTGIASAKQMYGARGWMLHHNTDIWRSTGIVDGAFWGLWPTANAWLCQHLWEHYLYTGDKAFLEKYYPIMKSASQYFLDALQTNPDHNWLVVSPSVSPEHEYLNGKTAVSVTSGATMDNQLVFDLFSNTSRAAKELKVDHSFVDSLNLFKDKLPPMKIGKHGQLQEWLEDLDSPTDNHRHVSHLYGLYPSNQVSPFQNPKLFAAAKNVLLYRGDVSTGWSMAWKINLWARLLDGNHAYKLITDQIKPVTQQSGGTYPNFFDAHPPFQIDGNFGCTAGISEMLIQSHDGAIYLLPALPDAWPKGNVQGLVARGGFKIDLEWEGKKITKLVIYSALGGNCRLRLNQQALNKMVKKAVGQNKNQLNQGAMIKEAIMAETINDLKIETPDTWLYDFMTTPGKSYVIIDKKEN
ncbi:glycoside hydrolase family 95 protein [Pedobacter frigiditerrae]|uniref:Glycoside hydrolase family 95 protein n=1 Tax=Pedobacter frigiditerrae TaxID=2530452 RepID=A0A4R0N1T9_9SPHI|nr:glycoside hydrolase family 95 protein [Pedobacter frigiditerrae]TCC93645.1 glycoside hydrolase family 95 protein [Pedobacter frigiditerrae]